MKKWIYKITNNINGKNYIGQSKNPKKRFQQHIYDNKNSTIHNAIKKYGIENFTFSVIEGPIDNYNERERYWIQYYDSYYNGYNNTEGGEEPPIMYGDQSTLALYDENIILRLQLDLINTSIDYNTLAQRYGVSIGYLTQLKIGTARYNAKFIYPLRKQSNISKSTDILKQIALELQNTTKSVEQIAKDYNVDSLTVYRLNLGKQQKAPKEFEYPIRQSGSRISKVILSHIIYDLLDNKLKLKDIEQKYNLSKSTINRINQGKQYKQEHLKYPLRPSNKRVYN